MGEEGGVFPGENAVSVRNAQSIGGRTIADALCVPATLTDALCFPFHPFPGTALPLSYMAAVWLLMKVSLFSYTAVLPFFHTRQYFPLQQNCTLLTALRSKVEAELPTPLPPNPITHL